MLYIGNTFFELELEGKIKGSLESAFLFHPIFEQLQYLPLLYLHPGDTLLVTKLPPLDYLESLKRLIPIPRLVTYDEPSYIGLGEVKSWGASPLIEAWAKAHHLLYSHPPFDLVKQINSKVETAKYTNEESVFIVYSEKELLDVITGSNFDWVVKLDQGFSGRGHLIFSLHDAIRAVLFCKNDWELKRGVILERWLDRVVDFSSQWEISQDGSIELLGVTKCLNTKSGQYAGTVIGDLGDIEEHVDAHVSYCRVYLNRIRAAGFFGPIGIDAMVYNNPKTGAACLRTIVEVNARMTMSSALLRFSKGKKMHFSYSVKKNESKGLLPFGYKRQLNVVY